MCPQGALNISSCPPHLLFSLASSSAHCLNSSYIFLLKLSLRKKDQNLNRVFISWDWPIPNRFLSEKHRVSLTYRRSTEECEHFYNLCWILASFRTVKAPSAVLVVSLLSEAVVPQQLVGWMPEFGQRLGGASIASRQRRSFWRGGVGAAVGGQRRREDVSVKLT